MAEATTWSSIGGGHNGLVAAAYLAKAGRKVTLLERRARVGGILANTELAPGCTAPAIAAHGRAAAPVGRSKDLKLGAHGLELIRPDVRVFAPQPDGGGRHVLGRRRPDRRGAARGQRDDAAGYAAFDQKVRALASFLAYVNAATPPDIKSPSLADAIAGLKLGKAFRGLGAKAGREATRALPMAVADFVARGLRARRGGPCGRRLARRAVYVAWARGRPVRRRCS